MPFLWKTVKYHVKDTGEVAYDWARNCWYNGCGVVAGALGRRRSFLTYLDTYMTLEQENAQLREIITKCASAAGAAVSTECTLDFLAAVPAEIEMVVKKLQFANTLAGKVSAERHGNLKFEMFSDSAYWDMWCVRPVNDKSFDSPRNVHFIVQTDAINFKEFAERGTWGILKQ